jgi:hypothetical protein
MHSRDPRGAASAWRLWLEVSEEAFSIRTMLTPSRCKVIKCYHSTTPTPILSNGVLSFRKHELYHPSWSQFDRLFIVDNG